jgi:nucleoside-diphosphate-sugar epimerase
MDKVLITGTNSGLGKFLYENIPNSISLTRDNRKELINNLKDENVDLIIHCAFGSQGGYEQNNIIDYFKYIDDNILLTKELTDIPHKKIIYISSLAVYDPNPINYKFIKLYSESIITTLGTNPLILRCPAMLGQHMRPNNILRLINDCNTQLSLTKDSSFNYVLHSDILDFILYCYENNINDIIPFVSSTNITIKEISNILGVDANYGNYTFNTMLISNETLLKYTNKFNKTSQEVFKQFLQQYKK